MVRLLFGILLFSTFTSFSQADGFVAGKTTGKLPYLEYGLGSDRLGGAKMTYLDTGIVVKIVDSTLVNYRVQLSRNHFAYLPKSNCSLDNNVKLQPYYLTSSWLINGDDDFDYVGISLDERLPYSSLQQINPSRIVVDIYGATSNTNWITHRTTATEVKNAYMEQIEDDVCRVIIELKHKQHWGYSIFYRGNRLMIRIKRQPKNLELKDLLVAVDAGHGGSNIGARGARSGIYEKVYTLSIAKELQNYLENEKAEVFMTRTGDQSLSMIDRIEMLEQAKPAFLISIHLNSSVRDSVRGTSTYYRYIGFRPLSEHIYHSLLNFGMEEFGNVGNFNFALSGPTEYPNCLVEVAFLSNPEDEKLILEPEFHKGIACQIVEGIKKWLKECREDD